MDVERREGIRRLPIYHGAVPRRNSPVECTKKERREKERARKKREGGREQRNTSVVHHPLAVPLAARRRRGRGHGRQAVSNGNMVGFADLCLIVRCSES